MKYVCGIPAWCFSYEGGDVVNKAPEISSVKYVCRIPAWCFSYAGGYAVSQGPAKPVL